MSVGESESSLPKITLSEHEKVSRRGVDLFLSAKNTTTTTQQHQQQKEMKTKKKKNSNDDDETHFIKVSSKLLQGLRLSPVVVEIGRGKNGVFVPVEEDDEIGEENLDFDVSVKEKGRAKKRSASSPSVLVGDIIER